MLDAHEKWATPPDLIPLREVIDSAIRSAKDRGLLLEEHVVVEGRKILRSGPGKSADQDPHFDYPLDVTDSFQFPLKSLIVAIENGARIKAPGNEDIVLQRGDYVLFGSRFYHAGSGYRRIHYRLFAYLGPQGFQVGNITEYGKDWVVKD